MLMIDTTTTNGIRLLLITLIGIYVSDWKNILVTYDILNLIYIFQ